MRPPVTTQDELDRHCAAVVGSIMLEPALAGCGISCLDLYLAIEYAIDRILEENEDAKWDRGRPHYRALEAIQWLIDQNREVSEESILSILEEPHGWVGDTPPATYLESIRLARVDENFNERVQAIGICSNFVRESDGFDPSDYDDVEHEPRGYRFHLDPTPLLTVLSDQRPKVELPIIDFSSKNPCPKIDYLVPGVLAAKQPFMIVGPPKSLKTSMALDVAVSVATGTKWLDYFQVSRKTPVVFASAESGTAVLKDCVARIAKARNIDLADLSNLSITPRAIRFGEEVEIEAFESLLRTKGAKVAIIDPYAMCRGLAAATTDSAAYQELGAITDACNRCGTTLVLVAHTTKSPGKYFDFRAAAGAGIAAWARQWITLEPRQRFVPLTGEHKLRMTAGGSAGHAGEWDIMVHEGNLNDPDGRKWDVNVTDVTDSATTATKRSTDADSVYSAFKVAGPSTKSSIRSELGWSGDRLNAAIEGLVQNGRLSQTQIKTTDSTGRSTQREAYEITS